MVQKHFICIVFIIIFCSKTYGQTCCSAGAPISSFLEISSSKPQTVALQFTYEYKGINLLVDHQAILKNDPRNRHGQNLGLKLDYTLTERWAFSAVLPLVQQSRSTMAQRQSSIGIGDLSLLTQFNHDLKNQLTLSISSGLKIPTGKVNHKDLSGIFLSPDMQSGTGSFDFLVRSSIAKEQFLLPFLSASLSAVYRKNGRNNNFAETETFGGRSFAFGNEITIIGSLRYLQVFKYGFLIPDMNLKVRWSKANSEQNTLAPNSGGNWFSFPFGITWMLDEFKSIRLYSELPVYQKLNGLQITTNFVAGIQLNYNLNVKKNKIEIKI